MKDLEDLALEYAKRNYPINDELDIIRHNIAKYSFADGFNEAMSEVAENLGLIRSCIDSLIRVALYK